jgi:hypothetical protein
MGEIEDGRTAAGEARSNKRYRVRKRERESGEREREGRQRKSEICSILVPEGRT